MPDTMRGLAEALHISKLERVEPQLGLVVILLNVDMRWFITIGHEEKEPITPFTKNSRHTAMLSEIPHFRKQRAGPPPGLPPNGSGPRDWTGVHMVRAILEGEPLTGYWFDRTKEYGARLRRETPSRLQYATEETVVLSQLPCWDHLSAEEYRNRIKGLVTSIEREAVEEMEHTQIPPVGAEKILHQSPHTQPKHSK